MKSLNINYMTRLDHLRFFAAILVVFIHIKTGLSLKPEDMGYAGAFSSISNFIKNWIFNGSVGVSLFLVLTGFLFCIISDLGHKKINYSGFIYNRILRIFPLVILLVFIILTVNRQNSTPMDIFRIFTLQLNTGHKYSGWGHEFYPSGPIWTIAVEFQFYLLFPYLAMFLAKYGVKYLIALVGLIILIKYNLFVLNGKGIYSNLYHSIIGRLDQFIIGMIFGVIYKSEFFTKLINKQTNKQTNKNIFCLVGICISLLVLMCEFGKKNTLVFTIEAICFGFIIIFYLSMNLFNSSILDKILARLGELSFSIYLLHLPIVSMLNKMFNFSVSENLVNALLLMFFKLFVVICVSFLTFYTIEKPFMSLRVKYTK